QTPHAGVAQHRTRPRGGLIEGHLPMNFAHWSSSGRTTSRPSGGRSRSERVAPALRKSSSLAWSGGAAKIETEIVFRSRPFFAAISRSSFQAPRSISGLRPRGNQPSQKSTTRCSVYFVSPPSRTGGYGFWAGLGHAQLLSKLTYFPWNSASSLV